MSLLVEQMYGGSAGWDLASGHLNLSKNSVKVWSVKAGGGAVILPDARTMLPGRERFVFSRETFSGWQLRDNAGGVLINSVGHNIIKVHLRDNTTQAGVWATRQLPRSAPSRYAFFETRDRLCLPTNSDALPPTVTGNSGGPVPSTCPVVDSAGDDVEWPAEAGYLNSYAIDGWDPDAEMIPDYDTCSAIDFANTNVQLAQGVFRSYMPNWTGADDWTDPCQWYMLDENTNNKGGSPMPNIIINPHGGGGDVISNPVLRLISGAWEIQFLSRNIFSSTTSDLWTGHKLIGDNPLGLYEKVSGCASGPSSFRLVGA